MKRPIPESSVPARGLRAVRRRAFTLVEMLIVVGIMAVLATLAVPAVQSWTSQPLESVARVTASDLRLARSYAVQFNTEFTVRFDVSANAYEIVHTGSGDPPRPRNPLAGAGEQDGRYRIELDRLTPATARPIRLAGAVLAPSGETVEEIRFQPSGGTGPHRNEDTLIRLASGSGAEMRTVQLRVSWVTGQVWKDDEVRQ